MLQLEIQLPSPVGRRRQAIANRMLAEGWSVFNTRELPDLMCVKGSKVRMIKVYNPEASEDSAKAMALEALKKAGVEVEVKGSPANPHHNGQRMTTSVNIKPEDKPFFEKLKKIQESKGKDISQWFRERMVTDVMAEMSGSV